MRARPPAVSWFKHCQPAITAAGIGLLMTFAATYAVGRWENGVTRAEFGSATKNQVTFLQNGIDEYLQRLTALRTFFESVNEEVTRSEFEFFNSRLFADHPSILRVSWLPRVRRKERAEFENAARSDGLIGYHFQSIAADGVLVPDTERDEYFPVFYSTDPKTSNAYGIDLMSEKARRSTIERARDNDVIAVLPNIEIYGSPNAKNAVLVAVPVYVKGTSRDTVSDRRRNIAGFIVGRFELSRLIETMLSTSTPSFGVHLDIIMPATRLRAESVHRFFPGLPATLIDDEPLNALATGPQWSGTLQMGDAIWFVSASPLVDSALSANHDRAIIVASAGIVMTTMLVAYLLFTSYQSRQLALANRRVYDLAQMDVLTDLANRSHFMQEIEGARGLLVGQGRPFSILMIDLDGFKEVNDMLGHATGDTLLKAVGQRVQGAVCERDVLARLGGDEFAILHPSSDIDGLRGDPCESQREHAKILAMSILDAFREPFDLEGSTMFISTSIGIALAPDDGVIAEELLKKADLALYESKSNGRASYCFYDLQMTARAAERHGLKADMRIGLERGEFEVDYQPFVEVTSRRIAGVEALVRWRHPLHGRMPPDHFIPLAEESGLIVPLGEWVLRQACQDAKGWPEHIKVAVNLSAVQFRGCNLLDVINLALADSGLPPQRLEVEVTESVLLEKHSDYLTVLHQLKNIGVTVALDDFGTGYSSLSYLKQFPFNKIKIDRSFIKDITERADCAAIVNSVTSLGRSLNIVTTAEGVETEEQFEIVRVAGVTLVQGYLFGKPQRKNELKFGKASLRRRKLRSDQPVQAA
jgi:diguanylate cyclase (GGDEF)-like protein